MTLLGNLPSHQSLRSHRKLFVAEERFALSNIFLLLLGERACHWHESPLGFICYAAHPAIHCARSVTPMRTIEQQSIIQSVADEVRNRMSSQHVGHDWWHAWRVWQLAKRIGEAEDADLLVVEIAALLHDIADWKFHGGDETVGPQSAKAILRQHGVGEEVTTHVVSIIASMNFKGAGVLTPMTTLEGKVVQDADRLDAIGAIGIARTFAYGGMRGHPIHDPRVKPILHASKEEYFRSNGSAINHFYEKLLLLKDRMNTKTARELAEGRHVFMEAFLNHFFTEWDGQQ